MAKTSTSRIGLVLWGAGTDSFQRTDMNTVVTALENKAMLFQQGTLSARPTSGVAGRFYFVTGDSATNNNKTFYDTGTTWVGFNVDSIFDAGTGSGVPLTARAATTQTPNIFQVIDNAGTNTWLRVGGDGLVTTQQSLATSAGAYFGRTSSHNAAGLFIGVAAAKPVLVARGVTSQSVNPFIVQDVNQSTLFSVSPTGQGVFASSVTATQLVSTSSVSAVTLAMTGASTLKNTTVTPIATADVPFTVSGLTNQSGNLIEFRDGSAARMARVSPGGAIATNTRVVIGNASGDSSVNYSGSTPALLVNGTAVDATVPVARLVAGSGQTSNLFEIQTSGGSLRYYIDAAGNSGQNGNSSSLTSYIGASGAAPAQFAGITGNVVPRFEVLTGTATEAYEDWTMLRHTGSSSTVATRIVGLMFKQNTEAADATNTLSGGLALVSNAANSGSPVLGFYVGNVESMRVSSAGLNLAAGVPLNVSDSATLNFGTSLGTKINLYGTAFQIGIQSSSFFQRAGGNFYWYRNGTYDSSAGTPGTGGDLLGSLTGGTENRFTTGRITLTSITSSNTATPTFMIGSVASGSLRMETGAISRFAANSNSTFDDLYLNGFGGNGGSVVLGNTNTTVSIPSRTIWTANNRVWFGNGTWGAQGGAPIPNDWWFDYSNNQIKVRNDQNVWKVVADDATFG